MGQIIRSVLSVFAGYLVFAVSAFSLFRVFEQPPHAPAPLLFMAGSSVFGTMTALAGGYVAGLLAGRAPFGHGIAVGVLLAVGATVSLAKTAGHGAIWSQVAAIGLMAPSTVAGGWLRGRTHG